MGTLRGERQVYWRSQLIKLEIGICTIVIISILGSIEGLAANINDIREATGNIRSDTEEFRKKAEDTISKYNEIEDKNSYVDFINSFNLEDKYRTDLDVSKKELESYKNIFVSSFSECKKFQDVEEALSNLRSQQKKVAEDESKLKGVEGKKYTENDYDKAYKKVQSLINSQNDVTDYGYIGNELRPILSNNVTRLWLPYGKYYEADGSEKLNYGIYLDTPSYEDVEVRSFFNGECTNKYQDENGQSVIEISSGDYIKTTYWYVDESYINIGDKVKQSDYIGKVYSKDNGKVYIDINLDGEYVNPLLLMGREGKEAYKTYVNAYGEKLVSIENLDVQRQISDSEIKEQNSIINGVNSTVGGAEVTIKSSENDEAADGGIESDGITEGNSADGDLDLVPKDVRKKEQQEEKKEQEGKGKSRDKGDKGVSDSKGNIIHQLN